MHAGASTKQHRIKRNFQPGIALYFSHTHDADGDSDSSSDDNSNNNIRNLRHIAAAHANAHAHAHRAHLAPTLPGQVQADLLSVGMRVRKSVPEGYKTHKPSPLPSPTHSPLSTPAMAGFEAEFPQDSLPDGRQRELLPFCGLHRIGGYAEQPTTNIHLYGGLDATGSPVANPFPLLAEAFTQPFSSRPPPSSRFLSSSQRQPNPHNPSKRSWQDEDEVSLSSGIFSRAPVNSPGAAFDDVPVSPLSEAPPQSMNFLPTVRQFAQPKSRRSAQRALLGNEDMDMDFENSTQVQGRVAAGSGSDFEEADFLGREVEME